MNQVKVLMDTLYLEMRLQHESEDALHYNADLEFQTEFNPGVDGNTLVDIVLQLCAEGLKVGATSASP